MVDWQGSDFVGVDSNAPGDGTTDSTRPLSSMLEHAVANNTRYLLDRRAGRSWTPFQQIGEEGWPVTSERDASLWRGYWPVRPTTDTLRAIFQLRLDSLSSNISSGDGLDVWSRVLAGPGQNRSSKRVEYNGGDDQEIVVEIDTSKIDQRQWVYWMVGTKNADRIEVASSAEGVPLRTSGEVDSANVTGDRRRLWEFENSGLFAHNAGNEEDFATYPAYTLGGTTDDVSAWDVPYVLLRTMILEEDFANRPRLQNEQLTHRIPYEAQWSGFRHGKNTQTDYELRRPVSLGHAGTEDPQFLGSENTNTSDAEIWPKVLGGEGQQAAFEDSAKLTYDSDSADDTQLEFRWDVVGVHFRAPYRKGVDSGLDKLKRDAEEFDVDLTYKVEQLGEGDTWSSPTVHVSETETVTINAYPTDETGRWPILQAMRHYRLDVSGSFRTTSNFPSDIPTEGQLWPTYELGLRDSISYATTVPTADIVLDYPVRLRVLADITSTTASELIEVGFVTVDTTIWERPR